MILNNIGILKDRRTDCYSILFQITVADYLALIREIYEERGGIKGQREPLKSSSALRIRKQMVKDIKAGTILPPLVLGLIVDESDFTKIPQTDNQSFKELLKKRMKGDLTIIDGMQRTAALSQAIEQDGSEDLIIRVEFWIATKLNSLIYRMLVLNTGQVPWNLRRQIETVFSSMINEMKKSVPLMEVYDIDEGNRRSQGGQYHANDLIELYLAFGGRKEKVDTKERLADEFTRLDFIEATEKNNFSDVFYQTLEKLTALDIAISQYSSDDSEKRFSNGKDLFKSQPARVGFVASVAKKIYGRPGYDKPQNIINQKTESIMTSMDKLIERLKGFDNEELGEFISFILLSEKLSIKSSRVGDFEREYFAKAFETLIDEGENIPSLDICWLAY